MRFLIALSLVLLSLALKTYAYPHEQLKECILSTKQSPIILGAPESSIESYCDCALIAIVDDEKDARSSIDLCASANFG